MEDLIILHGHDILYGIPYSEACNQQGCAAAYADDHHKETLLISEYIPDGNLLQKFEPVPESRDPFKENPLACRRSLGPYQLSRGFAKFLMAGIQGGAYRTQYCHCQSKSAGEPVKDDDDIGKLIHHLVDFPDDGCKHICSGKKSCNSSYDSGTA